jgi:RimJ/RimL family protein N-acetyltransferase
MPLKLRVLLPTQVQQVYDAVKDHMPDHWRSLDAFAQLYLTPSSAFFEVGEFEGVVWLTNLIIGRSANIHIVMWDSRIADKLPLARKRIEELMDMFRIRRLSAWIPIHATKAQTLAEALGFQLEGVLRIAEQYNNQLVDLHAYSLLKEERNG